MQIKWLGVNIRLSSDSSCQTVITGTKFWKFIVDISKDRGIHVTDGYFKTTFTEELMDILQEWERYNSSHTTKMEKEE